MAAHLLLTLIVQYAVREATDPALALLFQSFFHQLARCVSNAHLMCFLVFTVFAVLPRAQYNAYQNKNRPERVPFEFDPFVRTYTALFVFSESSLSSACCCIFCAWSPCWRLTPR